MMGPIRSDTKRTMAHFEVRPETLPVTSLANTVTLTRKDNLKSSNTRQARGNRKWVLKRRPKIPFHWRF